MSLGVVIPYLCPEWTSLGQCPARKDGTVPGRGLPRQHGVCKLCMRLLSHSLAYEAQRGKPWPST